MARPADTYTHSQFEPVQGAESADTVRCRHCKRWQGSNKVLNREKAHLASCQQYQKWRAAGNGQDLAPRNPYSTSRNRGSSDNVTRDEPRSQSARLLHGKTTTKASSKLELDNYFDRYVDDTSDGKRTRARCRSCGFIGIKDSDLQTNHLRQCSSFLATPQGAGLLDLDHLTLAGRPPSQIRTTGHTTPISQRAFVHLRSTSDRAHRSSRSTSLLSSESESLGVNSFARHLLRSAGGSLEAATQHPLLSHATCGSFIADALHAWLAQISLVSRCLVTFTGAIIGKIRIPETSHLQGSPTFRCLDLLCSAVSNMKNEIEFLEAMKRKYSLYGLSSEPRPATRAIIDLCHSASCTSSSLLEGMVLLWAIEILFHESFVYAGDCVSPDMLSSLEYSYNIPAYLSQGRSCLDHGSLESGAASNHVIALREAFIQNWRSENFRRFTHACRVTVDDLAITTATSSADKQNCERVFKQAIWLWGQMLTEIVDAEADADRSESESNAKSVLSDEDDHMQESSDGHS